MKTLEDVESLMEALKAFKTSIQNYQLNMVLGVKTGMVRSVKMCRTGYNAFVQKHRQVADKGAQGLCSCSFLITPIDNLEKL